MFTTCLIPLLPAREILSPVLPAPIHYHRPRIPMSFRYGLLCRLCCMGLCFPAGPTPRYPCRPALRGFPPRGSALTQGTSPPVMYGSASTCITCHFIPFGDSICIFPPSLSAHNFTFPFVLVSKAELFYSTDQESGIACDCRHI